MTTSSRRQRTDTPTRQNNAPRVNPNPNPGPSTAGETDFRLAGTSELNLGLNQLFHQMNEDSRNNTSERESTARRDTNIASRADDTMRAARAMVDRHRRADTQSETSSSNRAPSGGNEGHVARDENGDNQSSGSETTLGDVHGEEEVITLEDVPMADQTNVEIIDTPQIPNTNGRRGQAAVRFNSSNPEEDRRRHLLLLRRL